MRLIDEQGRLLGRFNLIDSAAIFLGLFSAALLLHFSYHNILRHTALTLEGATPEVFVPGVNQFLELRGNGFKGDLQVKIGGRPPLSIRGVNESRVDVQLPEDLGPGTHPVTARNPEGRMVTRDDLFQIRWQPVVETIALNRWQADEKVYRITGKYFDPNCAIKVNGAPVLRSSTLNPQEVLITVPADSNKVWTELSIQNPSGGGIILGKDDLFRRMDPAQFHTKVADPKISRVIPNLIQSQQETGILILGRNFQEDCAARIGGRSLEQMEWLPPYAIGGSFPAYSLLPGENLVEVVNPDGKKAVASVTVAAETGWVDLELFFPNLSRRNLKNWFKIPGSPVQILKILDRRGKVNGAYAEVRLPVEIRGMEKDGDGSVPVCYFENKLLRISQRISFSLSPDRVVSAEVHSSPKWIRQITPQKDPP